MSTQFIDQNAPPLQGEPPLRPQDLPHGLLEPPGRVLEIVAKEKARFPPDIFTADAEECLTIDLTLQYHFDGLGLDVAYRSTPQGPVVLAIGTEEVHALRQSMTEDSWRTLKTWLF